MDAYRLLLRAFPRSFRIEYGEEMHAIFTRRRRLVRGFWPAAGLWAGALADILTNAARVHADLLRQDVRYTARTLRRAPGFTATAVLVAALGVAATTATFSITDHVLLRPLPFPDASRLAVLWQDPEPYGTSRVEASPANYRDWKRMSTSFEAMAAYRNASMSLVGAGAPEQLEGASVTADLLTLLGRAPRMGRAFAEADARPGAPGTAILGHGLWITRFGGDPGVVGRSVILNNEPHTVIGVMPADFRFPTRRTQIWTSLRFEEQDFEDRTDTYIYVVAKRRPGVSLAQARAEMVLVASQLERAHPRENAKTSTAVVPLRDHVGGQTRLLLEALFGAALCVLLIACTNLASLLIARGGFRRRELAVRTALGAGRERLVRQLMTESLILALCGGLLGSMMALAAVPLVTRLVPNVLPIAETPPVDLRVLAFAALVTALTGLGFGVIPSLRASSAAAADGLREGARAGSRSARLRSLLVSGEVMASVVLLVASGLLIRALWRVQEVDPGFRAGHVLTLRTALPLPKYEKVQARHDYYLRVLDGVRALPGVSHAAFISGLPMAMRGGIWGVEIPGRPQDPDADHAVSLRFVTPGFFDALGIPHRGGRDVLASDTREAPFVAVVSESLARRHWPGEDPLGRRFKIASAERTIVGVVGDVRVRGLEIPSEPQVYLPHEQVPDGSLVSYVPKDLAIRSTADASALVPAVRRIIADADPQQPISDVRMLADVLAAETAPRSVQVRVLGGFAAAALLLAGIGIHGLLAFVVSQRQHEIGVRLALGARPSDILTLIFRQGATLGAAGVIVGLVLAYAAGRALEALLAGVSPADPPAFLAALVLALLTTTAGGLLPAVRAARVDPLITIRADP